MPILINEIKTVRTLEYESIGDFVIFKRTMYHEQEPQIIGLIYRSDFDKMRSSIADILNFKISPLVPSSSFPIIYVKQEEIDNYKSNPLGRELKTYTETQWEDAIRDLEALDLSRFVIWGWDYNRTFYDIEKRLPIPQSFGIPFRRTSLLDLPKTEEVKEHLLSIKSVTEVTDIDPLLIRKGKTDSYSIIFRYDDGYFYKLVEKYATKKTPYYDWRESVVQDFINEHVLPLCEPKEKPCTLL